VRRGHGLRSGLSIREFCRQWRLRVSQFYWWRHRLEEGRPPGTKRKPAHGPAGFALVSQESGTLEAGPELVLGDGRRLRIARGIDEATLRAVLAAMESQGCRTFRRPLRSISARWPATCAAASKVCP
jgi:transposase-like protein